MKTKQQLLEAKLRKMVREELGKNSDLIKEAPDYYRIESDIQETWTDLSIITKDITQYLHSCYDAAGDELVAETKAAILKGIKNFRPIK